MSGKYKKILITVAMLLALVVGKIWYDERALYPIVNYPPKGSFIVALGDSLTVGVGATAKEKSYIGILEERLSVRIINKGVIGDTTEDALRRLDADVLSRKPDIVLVLLGSNDYLKRIPQETTFENLHTIITRIEASGAVVVLLGARGGLLNDKFSDDFGDLAKESGALFVPQVMDGVIGEAGLMSDEIHPNDAGYLKMADKIAPTLLGVVLAGKSAEGKAQ